MSPPTHHRYLSTNIKIQEALDLLKMAYVPGQHRPKVVVLGTGWASIGFLGAINRKIYDVTVVSPRPHFTFNPLLPSVVGGAIGAESARMNMNALFGNDIKFKEDAAKAIDPVKRVVLTEGGVEVPYDHLIYAVGTTNNTFGIAGVEENSFFLKEWEDATVFHNHIKSVLTDAKAKICELSEEELRAKLHFAVVGAGPTGTEVTAEMVDFIDHSYPELKPHVKITLIDMMHRVLPMYSEKTSEVTMKNLKSSPMVEVLLKCAMTKRTEDSITLKTKDTIPDSLMSLTTMVTPLQGGGCEFTLHTPTVLWASGVTQRPITKDLISKQLAASSDPNVRLPPGVLVDQNLRAKGMENVFVLGDNAVCQPSYLLERAEELVELGKGQGQLYLEPLLGSLQPLFPQVSSAKPLTSRTLLSDLSRVKEVLKTIDATFSSPPPTAQNAKQQGEYLANVFNGHGPLSEARPAFLYHNKGAMCYIGGDKAIIEFDKLTAKGMYGSRTAGLLWRCFYSLSQKSYPKKLAVLSDFAFRWTGRKLRLI